jgi:hypothetical protein
MSDVPMTEEEYLRARGWKQSIGAWSREYGDRADWMPTAEAVAVQLDEDRRVLAFVLARSPSLSIGDDMFGSAAFARTAITYLDEKLEDGEVNEDV